MPELAIDLEAEAARLTKSMDKYDCVKIFLSEGAGVDDIVAEMRARGEEPERDAFGHVNIDKINPGEWFAKRFATMLGAEKVLVQKSGYFARSAAANDEDFKLVKAMVKQPSKAASRAKAAWWATTKERGRAPCHRISPHQGRQGV